MTHYSVNIEKVTPEIRKALEQLKKFSGVTVVSGNTKRVCAWDRAIATGAVSFDEFGEKFKEEIHNAYKA